MDETRALLYETRALLDETRALLDVTRSLVPEVSDRVHIVSSDKVYIVSQSMKTAKEDPFECLPNEQIEQELTVEFLQRFEEEVKESGEKVLLILDDVVNDIRKNKGVDKVLAKILYNRRHITADGGDDANGVTVWLTTQSYNRIPLMIRKVANGIIAFTQHNLYHHHN
eukprot:SAG22_NODE_716_length_7715_cov_6.435399_1_plen_169_part_00